MVAGIILVPMAGYVRASSVSLCSVAGDPRGIDWYANKILSVAGIGGKETG